MVNDLPQFGIDLSTPFGRRYIGGQSWPICMDQCWADRSPGSDFTTPCGVTNRGDSLGLCREHRGELCGT